MDTLVIEGGVPLSGHVRISGAKNAALPLLFASILCEDQVIYDNVPELRDIHTTLKLLHILGLPSTFENHCAVVTPGPLKDEAPYDLVKTMRASVLCLGPLLARNGHARVAMPGGCAIGARPVDLHLSALEKMGATFELEEGYIIGSCKRLKGAHIHFDFPTVGGTENILMAACLAEGETILENAAREPEISDLAHFLIACGARIEGHGSSIIRIQGVSRLGGARHSIMPDRIEAGTFLIAAGITGGNLTLQHCPHEALEVVIEKLRAMGMAIAVTQDFVTAAAPNPLQAVDISTRPYPGFPTDMQAQIMSLLCLSQGSGVIEENIFENRFMHVQELIRMGADIHLSGPTAIVRGVKRLNGAPVMASDLRASASLVLAGLAARGKTTVQRIYHLDRGYEHMETKLSALGARISRVPE